MVGDESTDNDSDVSEEEDKHAQVSEKLRRERLEASGKYFRDMATSVRMHNRNSDDELERGLSRMTLGGHKLSVTSVVLSNDEASIFSGSKTTPLFTGTLKQVRGNNTLRASGVGILTVTSRVTRGRCWLWP